MNIKIPIFMSTLSVSLTPELEKALQSMVEDGVAPNTVEVVLIAIKFFEEKLLSGNLDDLLKLRRD